MPTIKNNSTDWVTTNNLLTTMSRLLSSLMLLSLMVLMVNTMPKERCGPDDEGEKIMVMGNMECIMPGERPEKREALDAPMAQRTERGEH